MNIQELFEDEWPLDVTIIRNFIKKGGKVHLYFGGAKWIYKVERAGTSTHFFYKEDGAATIPDSLMTKAKITMDDHPVHDKIMTVKVPAPGRPPKRKYDV